MKKYRYPILSAFVIFIISQGVHAAGYLGASIGFSSTDEEGFEDDNGFRLSGGFDLNRSFSIEASYTNLGEFEADGSMLNMISSLSGYSVSGASVEISGIEFSIVGVDKLSDKFSAYGRVGFFMWDADLNVHVSGYGSGSDNEDGSDLALGFGLMYEVSPNFKLKAGYSLYDVYDVDLHYTSVGANFGF
ncbi:outer membrane beta-barrel protein [Ketobacter alkanivorans]|uniref:Outer membrane protein beta-barrel domain-containing protein n=1 Tax=Ketobacter alkanivorans TaxID=1917421 RepID=A0A2K9LRD3_9GAMM|nr:outer membrane beta-barrel protein [Ketobacter alkanivorans]AUM14701.1 hypothetical protein Kalk_20705 [Ketobacter alkanivorans]